MLHFFITSEDIYHKILSASSILYCNSFHYAVAVCQLLPQTNTAWCQNITASVSYALSKKVVTFIYISF